MNLNRIFRKFTNYFACSKYFKFVEEHTQLNTINSIAKDNSGEIVIEISPLGSNNIISMKISDFFVCKNFTYYLSKKDHELVKLLLLCEGDVFVESRIFESKSHNAEEILSLSSLLTDEKWTITKEELLKNNELLSRLNKKYFKQDLLL